jgi:hypothetical protein
MVLDQGGIDELEKWCLDVMKLRELSTALNAIESATQIALNSHKDVSQSRFSGDMLGGGLFLPQPPPLFSRLAT